MDPKKLVGRGKLVGRRILIGHTICWKELIGRRKTVLTAS